MHGKQVVVIVVVSVLNLRSELDDADVSQCFESYRKLLDSLFVFVLLFSVLVVVKSSSKYKSIKLTNFYT